MHCTYLLALKCELGTCAHVHIQGWLALEQSSSCLVTPFPVSLAQKWLAGLSAARQAQVPIIRSQDESGISAKQKPMFLWQVPPSRKEQKCVVACTCLSRTIKPDWTDSSNSTDWEPESASTVQDLAWILISRINVFFSTERKAKNDTKGTFSCRSAAESRSFCNADLLPQLSCPPNPTQHAFKEHQLVATLLRCALQCTSVGPCKTWPFVHDQPLARRLQLESRMTCKALLASEDAQRASLFCFYLLSRA